PALFGKTCVVTFNKHDPSCEKKIDVTATAITCKITIREMIDLNRITLFLGDEIADAAYGMNPYPGAFVGELFPEAMDIDFDDIRGDVSRKPEDVILNLLL